MIAANLNLSFAHSRVDVALGDVWVVIPVRNEKSSLPLVLQDLPCVGRVIVADNGSTDGSADVARHNGAAVVTEQQAGYGKACQAF